MDRRQYLFRAFFGLGPMLDDLRKIGSVSKVEKQKSLVIERPTRLSHR